MKAYLWLLLLVLVMAGLPSVSTAATCTPGTDCYCDCVNGPATIGNFKNAACQTKNVPVDPVKLLCEDFEPNNYHDDVGFGNGAPFYGPWYDGTDSQFPCSSSSCDRGRNSLWQRRYTNGVSAMWTQGQPGGTPLRGFNCSYPICTGAKEWRLDNLWGGNNGAQIDMIRNGEFGDEIASIGAGPSRTSTGGSGVFDGQTSMGHRVPAGTGGQNGGITGFANWGTPRFQIGITMVVAYASNSVASGVWGGPWKHNEWLNPDGTGNNGMFLFHNTTALSDADPFDSMFFFTRTTPPPIGDACTSANNANAAGTVRRGNLYCNSSGILWQAVPAQGFYNRSTMWPMGTWGCVRGYFTNMNSTNWGVKIWFQGPGMANEVLIIDFDGVDDRFSDSSRGVTGIAWNNYANQNSGTVGYTPTNQTTYRYEDNIHIREGAPVSCAQIGYGSSSGNTTPPAAPTGLTVQ